MPTGNSPLSCSPSRDSRYAAPARGTGEKPVCRKRPEDELAPEDRAKNLHHQRMLHHIDENLPFVEQVPDTPLQVDFIRMTAMEMCCRLHTIGMMIDDPVCCSDLSGLKTLSTR